MSSKVNEPIEFFVWMSKETDREIYIGTGRRNAWEYGAKAALGGKDFGRIYHRNDCARAESAGRRAAERALARGVKILCPCCRQLFPKSKA